jgi:hypothetical protein
MMFLTAFIYSNVSKSWYGTECDSSRKEDRKWSGVLRSFILQRHSDFKTLERTENCVV